MRDESDYKNEHKAKLFDSLFHNSAVAILVVDKDRKVLEINEAFTKIFGFTKEELVGDVGIIYHTSKSSYEYFGAVIFDKVKTGEPLSLDYQFRHKDGSLFWGHVSGDPIGIDDEVLWTITDITKRKQIEEELKVDKNYLQALLDGIADPIMVIAPDYTISHMNKATQKNVKPQFIKDLHQPKCYEISHRRSSPCEGVDFPCPLQDVIDSKQSKSVIHTHPDPEETYKKLEVIANPLFDELGAFQGIIETSRDVTSYLQIQEELQEQKKVLDYQAHHDPLTELPNRTLFYNRLEQAIKYAKQNNNCVGVVFIDCDNFKEINDSLGHDVGDEVLQQVAKRMQMHTRFTDTCSRLGGDEFTIILDAIKKRDDVEKILNHITDEVKMPMNIQGHTIDLTLSIGVSLYPYNGSTPKELLKNADTAMYNSKKDGRNQFSFYHGNC